MASSIKDLQRDFIDAEVARMLERNKKQYENDLDAAKAQTLRDIGKIMFSDCPRALANIDRFLGASGEDWQFDLMELFAEDKNARERVYGEVTRRTLSINTYGERKLQAHATPVHENAINPEITIFQSTYSSKDWWGSLGTFNIVFLPVRSSSDGRIFVSLTGQNTYKWYKDAARVTQTIHAMASELEQKGKAKRFSMVAKPRTYAVSPWLKSMLLFEEQVNPRIGVLDRLTSRMDTGTATQYIRDRLGW